MRFSGAGLIVILIAALAMAVCALYLDEIARIIPDLTILQAKYLLLAVGFIVVGGGWLGLRLGGVSFTKKESISASSGAGNKGSGR